MVVAVVLVILMTFMFKLAGIGGDSAAINTTVDRMHRLENALSGYYAAFGTYPPVKLHGNRNIYLRVDDYGNQSPDEENTTLDWGQVDAACRAQPVACEFPFPKEKLKEYIDTLSDKMKVLASEMEDGPAKRIFERGFDDGVSDRIGRFAPYIDVSDWGTLQLFRFGLMSFLLPRYQVMMNSTKDFFESYAQWTGNNTLPRDPLTGQPMPGWAFMQQNYITKPGRNSSDIAHVANIPSQAACARWMASFDRSLYCLYPHVLFGVHVWEKDKSDNEEASQASVSFGVCASDIHVPGGFEKGDTSAQYLLDKVSMRDGWGNDFYYYSPAPYQSYVLWSAGPNGKTFPPWISRDILGGNDNKTVGKWIEDDIVNLSK